MRQISGHSRRIPFARHFIAVTADALSFNERCGRLSLVCVRQKADWLEEPT